MTESTNAETAVPSPADVPEVAVERVSFSVPGWVRRGGTSSWMLIGILIALAVSSALFAILHDRWALAALAGVAYGLLTLRAGRVTAAIQAHMASNILIAIWAVSMNDWDVI